MVTHDAAGMAPGRVIYTPWCDGDGHVRQEGTVFRFDDDRFMVTAAEPAYRWIRELGARSDARLVDRSAALAALSLQGPSSRAILAAVAEAPEGATRVSDLRFFRHTAARVAGVDVTVSRTGYTGDLGYEIWVPASSAIAVWDALMEGGRELQITPCGLAAMDISRVEAGFVLIGVDYVGADRALLEEHKMTPYELGLGWAVKLDAGPFVGRDALVAARRRGPRRRVVGLQADWEPIEDAYLAADLMPDLPMTPCREPVPVYSAGDVRQVGRVTTRVWSKLLKRYIAIATVDAALAEPGEEVAMEVTVNFARRRVPARVVKLPFFRPERARS